MLDLFCSSLCLYCQLCIITEKYQCFQFRTIESYLSENLTDLCDFLISCEKEAEAEHGNEIMKQMDELHYVYLLWDIIVDECKHFQWNIHV